MINEHEESTHFYRDNSPLRWTVQQFNKGAVDAELLIRIDAADVSCGMNLTADESLALAAALTKHANALRAQEWGRGAQTTDEPNKPRTVSHATWRSRDLGKIIEAASPRGAA